MKLYCFQCGVHGYDNDYPVENGIAIAQDEEQAWKLFFEKYEGFQKHIEGVERSLLYRQNLTNR